MQVVPKWLREWITRLLPKQENSGAGSVQIGKASKPVHVVNMNGGAPDQPERGPMQVGQVHGTVNHHHVQVTQHFYAAPAPAPMPDIPPRPAAAAPAQAGPSAREPQPLTEVHKEVLSLMEPLPKKVRICVLDFMRREFGTGMVKELKPHEVHRVRLYVLQIHANRRKEGVVHEFL
ncbi:hypothetical protein G8A07_15700 [Roseateles sp. DAIF2]|uniref:hypothetical protein n=1 Tax=Roseateles sp. DAIF2 TaxID=2714952 RepID=UPI0018A32D0A|nr:hypothetical protein [Roseateles sp. DAIF2]QPF74219.1 hypothetical protein G8A07_15700 [Roseateles sp. DAIF2]